MYKFIVNKNSDEKGLHEVHQENICNHLPLLENRVDLGSHSNCTSALQKVRQLNPNLRFDGCAYCAPSCHTG